MPTVVIDNVKGTDLPAEWLEKTGESSDQIFKVTIKVKKNDKPSHSKPNDSDEHELKKSVNQLHSLTAEANPLKMEKMIDEAVRDVRQMNK